MPVSIKDVQDSIKNGIISLGAGAHAKSTAWEDEPAPTGKTIFILSIVSMAALNDRECRVPSATPGQYEWKLSTEFYIRVQVRAESTYTAPGNDGLFAMEKIRAGLRRPDLVFANGVINQPDQNTYVHHLSFPHQAHITSAWAFETGFRAVVDYPLDGNLDEGLYNMQKVTIDAGEVDVDEDDPAEIVGEVVRP